MTNFAASKLVILAALAVPIAPAHAKKIFEWEKGVAVEQKTGSDRAGWYAGLTGRSVIAAPLYRQWNLVTVDAGPHRYQWQEQGSNHHYVFVINETFWFRRDGSRFVVVDATGKTHKFVLVSAIRK